MNDFNQTIKIDQIPEVINKDLCIGCGLCKIPLDNKKKFSEVKMNWSKKNEIWTPKIHKSKNKNNENRICPGKKMDMPTIANNVFGKEPKDNMVGQYRNIFAGYATNNKIRKNAASGGVTTALLTYLFNTNVIDYAYSANGFSPHDGKGVLVKNIEGLKNCYGSHYHPINFGDALEKLVKSNKTFAFVGLPCEIAAMRQIMEFREDIKKRNVIMIGLFCGGINRFSGISKYLSYFNIKGKNIEKIDYRDGVWPGQIRVTEKNKKKKQTVIPRIFKNTRINILRYMISFQGYSMLPRCRMCPDQMADFADISVGDPHLDRFKKKNSLGYSAIIARNSRGLKFLQQAKNKNLIKIERLSRDELVKSQGYTLENRRFTNVVLKLAKILKIDTPDIVNYNSNRGSLSWHQYIYAFVDLGKIKIRKYKWIKPFYLALQIFEYLFLTFSIRLVFSRIKKILNNK